MIKDIPFLIGNQDSADIIPEESQDCIVDSICSYFSSLFPCPFFPSLYGYLKTAVSTVSSSTMK